MSSNVGRMSLLRMALALGLVLSMSVVATAGPELLIRSVVDGRQTSLYEKVVVTSGTASIAKMPGGEADPIEPFAIFFKLKTEDGQKEQGGFIRIGTSRGDPLGWIKKEHLTDWNTRFILDPI